MKETFRDEKVTYTIEVEGRVVLVENVPARVCVETGEKFFSPDTVEHLQKLVWGTAKPKRIMEMPVYEYA